MPRSCHMSTIAPRRRTRRDHSEYLTGYLFVLPVVFFILAFIAYPLIQSLLLSFYKWDGIGPWEFVGIDNYVRMFGKDRYFWTALGNSFKYSIGASFGLLTVGFALAAIIDLRVRFWRLYRFVFFLPITVSTAVVALLWLRIVDPYGVLNTLFENRPPGGPATGLAGRSQSRDERHHRHRHLAAQRVSDGDLPGRDAGHRRGHLRGRGNRRGDRHPPYFLDYHTDPEERVLHRGPAAADQHLQGLRHHLDHDARGVRPAPPRYWARTCIRPASGRTATATAP